MVNKKECGELLPCGWCSKFDVSCKEVCAKEMKCDNDKFTVRNILNLMMENTYLYLNFNYPNYHHMKGYAKDIKSVITDSEANRIVEGLQSDFRYNKKGIKCTRIVFEIQ